MQFFFATPKRLHRVHSHFFVIVLGVTEGGFLLPELLPALTVDLQRHSRSVVLRRIIRHLLHSTTKLHSAAHKITAVIETHAQRRIFFAAFCVVSESCFFASSRIVVIAQRALLVSSLQAEEYPALRLPACPANSVALVCISVKEFCASCFVRSVFQVRVQLLCHKI